MKTAVLFLIFNRPDTTKIVFEKIRGSRPQRLYVAADGPRHDEEAILCEQSRSIISDIDWPCEVRRLYQEKNLGCKDAISNAIDWFFDHEEDGIIIEDDIVPRQEFFGFCELMLAQYRYEPKIMMISGFNPIGANVTSSEYFFSDNPSIWGWATWKDRWNLYDKNMSLWSEKKYRQKYKKVLPMYVLEQHLEAFEKTQRGLINTWDYQWTYTIQNHNGLAIKPYANLISNIGITGTHASVRDENHYIPYGDLNINRIHGPKKISINQEQDNLFYKRAYRGSYLSLQLKYFLRMLHLLPLLKMLFGK